MDHRLMSFAKAIIAEALKAGNSSRLDVSNLLSQVTKIIRGAVSRGASMALKKDL